MLAYYHEAGSPIPNPTNKQWNGHRQWNDLYDDPDKNAKNISYYKCYYQSWTELRINLQTGKVSSHQKDCHVGAIYIKGTVINGTTGKPIEGALVIARGASGATVYTDSSGSYSMRIAPGRYFIDIRVSANGLSTSDTSLDVISGKNFTQDFQLFPLDSIIKSSVSNGVTKKPISNAQVEPHKYMISCKTDSSGNFSLLVPSGTQEISVYAPRFAISKKSVTAIALGEITIDFELSYESCPAGMQSNCTAGLADKSCTARRQYNCPGGRQSRPP